MSRQFARKLARDYVDQGDPMGWFEALYAEGDPSPGGTLLVIARGRKPEEPTGEMPWPVVRRELRKFEVSGFQEVNFEEYLDKEDPPVRRFPAEYRRI